MLSFNTVVPFDGHFQADSLFYWQIAIKHSVSNSRNLTIVNGSLWQNKINRNLHYTSALWNSVGINQNDLKIAEKCLQKCFVRNKLYALY